MMVAPAEATDVEITNLKRTEKSDFFRNNRKIYKNAPCISRWVTRLTFEK